MKNNSIEFDLNVAEELKALAAFIAGLNANGVPYTLAKDKHAIAINVSTGF